MDINGKPDNGEILAHFAHLMRSFADSVYLSGMAISRETRESAQETANRYGQHLWDDLVFLVNGVKGDILDDIDQIDQIAQGWANES